MWDIDPTKSGSVYITLCGTTSTSTSLVPCAGYKKFAAKVSYASYAGFSFIHKDGSSTTSVSLSTTWTDYYDIPEDCLFIKMTAQNLSANYPYVVYYSMLTADSIYNPDNQ